MSREEKERLVELIIQSVDGCARNWAEIIADHLLNHGIVFSSKPLVHCKDCKYLGIKDFVYGYCKHNMCGIINPDDYCSQGIKNKNKR